MNLWQFLMEWHREPLKHLLRHKSKQKHTSTLASVSETLLSAETYDNSIAHIPILHYETFQSYRSQSVFGFRELATAGDWKWGNRSGMSRADVVNPLLQSFGITNSSNSAEAIV